MKSKRLSKSKLKDKAWQDKVAKKTKEEAVDLDHPKGKERFEKAIHKAGKNTQKPKR